MLTEFSDIEGLLENLTEVHKETVLIKAELEATKSNTHQICAEIAENKAQAKIKFEARRSAQQQVTRWDVQLAPVLAHILERAVPAPNVIGEERDIRRAYFHIPLDGNLYMDATMGIDAHTERR